VSSDLEPKPTPTHVLTKDAVRWGIGMLGAQRLHPTFVMYLYLRVQQRAGKLAEASATSEEVLALIEMPGNPTKPYYFPLIDRGKNRDKPLATFWRAPNIAGSWSPGSIRRLQGGGWLGASESTYAMPENHADLAFEQMLFGKQVSALAMGAYFLRNDGLVLSGEPSAVDVIAAFRVKFDYPAAADEEFSRLFSADVPVVDFSWFEEASDLDAEAGASEPETSDA
jgi:hypothetical protein